MFLRFSAVGALAVCALAQSGTAVVVGGREWKFPSGPMTPADTPLAAPIGLATASDGTVYVADQRAAVVVAIRNGAVSRVAGSGVSGYDGDGAPATNLALNGPGPLAVGADGSLYIADLWNYRIRRVSPDGTISTVAGNGTSGACADGAAATGPCIASIGGLAVDSAGNVYFSDSLASVYRVDAATGTISAYAGQLICPESLAIDGGGNLYALQLFDAGVKRIAPGGVVSIVPMGGVGTPAAMTALAVSANGTLYATYGGCDVLAVRPGQAATELASACLASVGFGVDQRAIAVDPAGNVYVADDATESVREVSPAGVVTTLAGNHQWYYSADDSAADTVALGGPFGDFAVLPSGDVAVAGGGRIRRITAAGAVETIVEFGAYDPVALAVAPNGDLLFADQTNCAVRRINAAGAISTFAGNGDCADNNDGSLATGAGLAYPRSLAFDGFGRLYVGTASAVRRIDSSGTIETIAGGANPSFQDNVSATQSNMIPQALAFAGGELLIADILNLRIRAVDGQGIISTVAGNGDYNDGGDDGPALSHSVGQVWSMTGDAQGNLWFSDSTFLRKLTVGGMIETVQGLDWNCRLCLMDVKGVRVSGSTLYVADWPVIRKLEAGESASTGNPRSRR